MGREAKSAKMNWRKMRRNHWNRDWKKGWTSAAVLMLSVGMLSSCGNDFEPTAQVKGREDLLQPLRESEQTGIGASGEEGVYAEEIQGEEAVQTTEALTGGIDMGEVTGGKDDVITITISAAGDVTLGNHKEQDYGNSFRQAYDQAEDKHYFFENVEEIFLEDDMTIVNLEGPLTLWDVPREGQTYSIKGDPEYAGLLTLGSIEAVSMGNNHRLDYGEEGSRDTVAALEQEGIVYAYDSQVGIYETQGIRIGFVSVNEAYWGAGVEKDMQAGIEQLKEEGVDLILACCHWGIEREYYPEDYQIILGRKCIDWGADLVIGHHPHVLQGIDYYQGKYIIYSLGNFCFGANRNPDDKDTMIFQQTFTFMGGEKQEGGEARIIPCYVSSVASRNDFKPTPAQGEEAARIIGCVNEYSQRFGVRINEDGSLSHP